MLHLNTIPRNRCPLDADDRGVLAVGDRELGLNDSHRLPTESTVSVAGIVNNVLVTLCSSIALLQPQVQTGVGKCQRLFVYQTLFRYREQRLLQPFLFFQNEADKWDVDCYRQAE